MEHIVTNISTEIRLYRIALSVWGPFLFQMIQIKDYEEKTFSRAASKGWFITNAYSMALRERRVYLERPFSSITYRQNQVADFLRKLN